MEVGIQMVFASYGELLPGRLRRDATGDLRVDWQP
jgi:hypothetical protein